MSSNVGSNVVMVTPDTRVEHLESLAKSSRGGPILAERYGANIVLYTAPRTFRSVLESALRTLFRRQPPPAESLAKAVTANIFMRSLPAHLKDAGRQKHLAEKIAAGKDGLTAATLRSRLDAFQHLADATPVGEANRFGSAEKFAGQKGEHTGGKTGSLRVKADGKNYQIKFDIRDQPSWLRRKLERSLNVQNVSEVLASAVMRSELQSDATPSAAATQSEPSLPPSNLFDHADSEIDFHGHTPSPEADEESAKVFFRMMKNMPIVGTDAEPEKGTSAVKKPVAEPATLMRAPNVTLLDAEGSRMNVVSEYLTGGKGNLEDYFTGTLGGTIQEGRHVKVVMGSEQPAEGTPPLSKDPKREGVIHIQGQAATDLYDHLASTLWLGDYDFNPAKFIVQEGADGVLRLGCIDLAHSFQNLTQGRGGSLNAVRDAVRNDTGSASDNSFVQAVNQKRLRGDFRKEGGGMSKIWRDYENLAPSLGLARALKRLAMRPDSHVEGLQAAKEHIMSLVEYLQGNPTPENKAKLEHLLETLAQISEHEGHSVRLMFRKPAAVVDEVIGHLTHVLSQRRKEAMFAADLCELQASTNAFYMPKPGSPTVSAEALAQLEERFAHQHGPAMLKKELVWFAESAGTPPFKGTYQQFVADRMRLASAQASAQAQPLPAPVVTAPAA
ncbi:hypothetical protein [Ramlibacter rhizophilus]|uniref:Uncharacterized protein n=1 Tax=Ramlibacter rhizophilus TaxID=1781167 RepID=A0A4Z0BRB6_9BURK|nr:hypothetical protein [Ramlibacter rhizophilus]TFZ01371.1 hypothetical protein EZ242_08305 [Ramlibacter rhizophilus]